MTDRNVTLGNGPFQPPKRTALEQAEQTILELRQELAQVRNQPRRQLAVTTESELVSLVENSLDVDDAEVDAHAEDEEVVITISGATIDDAGRIVAPVREYTVDATVTLEVTFGLTARREEADRAAEDILDELLGEVELNGFVSDDRYVRGSVGIIDIHRDNVEVEED